LENTLDEPIMETVMRDVRMIGYKLKYVLMPKMQEDKGKDLRKCNILVLFKNQYNKYFQFNKKY
jgi:hypothetical protein